MTSSCELLDAELALDRVEAELARELPPHVRAFAEAHAAGRPEPVAPALLRRPSTLAVARRAWPHPVLAERALALARLTVGERAIAAIHALHGRRTPPVADAPRAGAGHQAPRAGAGHAVVPPPVAGWREPDGEVLDPAAAWAVLAARHGAIAAVRFVATAARPRTFVVGPGEQIIAIPTRVDSPAARFAVRHELGHALAAALSPPGLPRALDEAVAAMAALDPAPIAQAARARRLALARHLDAVECGLVPPPAALPWSLVHDRGAQAAYVEAELLVEGLVAAPDLRAAIAAARAEIDRVATIDV